MNKYEHWTLAQVLAHKSKPSQDGCVLWAGFIQPTGYGLQSWNGHTRRAHRLAWEAVNGPIPRGMYICHHCDVRHCINPDHLFLGTHADNMSDRNAKGRQGTARGERNYNAKLTESQVREIISAPGPLRKIAAQFGVTATTISLIKNRKIWRQVDPRERAAA